MHKRHLKSLPQLVLALFLFTGFGSPACRAELSELQVKSSYVFNFIKFVEWPSATIKPGDKINLCVIGNNELQASLSALEGRKVGANTIQIIPHNGNESLKTCHVLFIGEQEQRRLVPIIKSLGDAPVLTISDIPGFAERGGSIGLLNRNDKMLFEVNLASTRKAELRLSGQMLNLAANIFGK
jgi:hypothetical protein